MRTLGYQREVSNFSNYIMNLTVFSWILTQMKKEENYLNDIKVRARSWQNKGPV